MFSPMKFKTLHSFVIGFNKIAAVGEVVELDAQLAQYALSQGLVSIHEEPVSPQPEIKTPERGRKVKTRG